MSTSSEWLDVVMADFDSFLLDHAACERKASATGISFIVRYPDRREMIDSLIEFAREELEHFHQMLWLTQARGLVLLPAEKDLYVQTLRSETRRGSTQQTLQVVVSVVCHVLVKDACGNALLAKLALPLAGDLATHTCHTGEPLEGWHTENNWSSRLSSAT